VSKLVSCYLQISDYLIGLEHPYPSSKQLTQALFEVLSKNDKESLEEFMKLWLTEGVPFVFKDIPILYERVRTLLSEKLDINFKEIFMIGSGKLGLSLDPKKFAEPFQYPESDLDFTIVNEGLFKNLEEDFWRWRKDYLEGRICPENAKEERFWRYNIRKVPDNIERGFIDIYKIPARSEYKTRYKFTSIVPLLRKLILSYTGRNFCDKKITFRVYKDWVSFFRQNEINLKSLKRS